MHVFPRTGVTRLSSAVVGPLGGLLLCAAMFVAGHLVRYRLVEPEAMGAACETAGPAWCPLRTAFIVFTQWNGFGWLALAAAILAFVAIAAAHATAARIAAFAALSIGGAGMVLYNATVSVPAVILALLCLAWRR